MHHIGERFGYRQKHCVILAALALVYGQRVGEGDAFQRGRVRPSCRAPVLHHYGKTSFTTWSVAMDLQPANIAVVAPSLAIVACDHHPVPMIIGHAPILQD